MGRTTRCRPARSRRSGQCAPHSRRPRFTLIELMVVVVVLAILIAVAVPQFVGARGRAQDGVARTNLRSALGAAGGYAAGNGGTYPDATQLAAEDGSLTFVGSSTVSTGPRSISVLSGATFAMAARSESGICIKVAVTAGGAPTWSTPTGTCSAAGAVALSLAGVVTTFAGSGANSHADGTGTGASFRNPSGLVVDSTGNLFVADNAGNRIRKITSAAVVTTFAGSGAGGSADGTGTAATFFGPIHLAIDAADNIYVADLNNYLVRKITPAGVVTTLAGSGSSGFVDGTGAAASFSTLEGIAVDSSGNVFVSDAMNRAIRKITPAGVVTTFAGGTFGTADGTGTGAQFNLLRGIGIDVNDNLFVADGNRIRKVTPAAVVTTFAGSGTYGHVDATGTSAQFRAPSAVAVDVNGDLYVSEGLGSYVRQVTAAAVVTTLAGSGTYGHADGTGASATFNQPQQLAISRSASALFVADTLSNRIRQIT